MKKTLRLASIVGFAGCIVVTAVLGVLMTGAWMILAAAIPAVVLVLSLGFRKRTDHEDIVERCPAPKKDRPVRQKPVLPDSPVYNKDDPAYLAQRMLEQGRFALLLRPQIAASLAEEQFRAALRCPAISCRGSKAWPPRPVTRTRAGERRCSQYPAPTSGGVRERRGPRRRPPP